MTKVLVIGLDGATWKIVKPLLENEKLHNISRIVNRGASGILESSIPTGTFPGWKCYSTGKNPGKLGVYSFLSVDIKNKRVTPNDSTSFDGKDFWDYLGKKDYTCGIINMPGTYPPKEVNGFTVAHSLIECKNFTYPKELEPKLKEKFNYRITPEHLYVDDKDKCIEDIEELIKTRVEATKYLIDKYSPQFLQLTFFYTDHVQHYYWRFMGEQDPKYGSAIERVWKSIDRGIGEVINYFKDNEDTYMILMGDHGFERVKGEFALGKWLIENGYMALNRKGDAINKVGRFGVNRENLLAITKNLRIYELMKKIIPSRLQFKVFSYLPSKTGITSIGGDSLIDWNRSKVLQLQGLYINKNIIESESYNKFRDDLINKLYQIKNPETGESLYRKIHKKEEVILGPHVDKSPDIIGVPSGYTTPPKYDANSLWSAPEDKAWSAHHDLSGMYSISGPGIREGGKLDATIYDLAPTILHIFGLPIPNDMDGRVLTEIFEEDSEPAQRKPQYVDPSYYEGKSEKERAKRRIKEVKKKMKS